MEVASVLIPSLEGLTQTEVRSMIYTHILRFTRSIPPSEDERNIVAVVDATNNSISFLEDRPINAEPILEEQLPASIASIKAIPMVKVLGKGIDCSICLSNFEIGEEAKEMHCKHHFHSICIDKWLGINRSCPICRYKMPVDKQCEEKDKDEIGDDGCSDMEEDRVMFIFHVAIIAETTHLEVSITEMNRLSDDRLIEVGVHRISDVFEAGDGDGSEAGNGDVSEASGNGDVSEASGNGDVSEARNGDVFEARNGDEFEARDDDVSEARDGDESEAIDDDVSEARDGDVSEDRDGDEAQDMVIDNN
ncbi:E3 ubiquitin-protein ligase RNF13-like [Solanum tuberosum]|uniref:Zinc finger protein n=1 Tax=Solanum tuberosum TaxID=4113 RepID=M1A8D9_SOLTU|nr:PREDICTED: E3 ubiquitin-protein ligase RNF13-like [Solanum tuberosum]